MLEGHFGNPITSFRIHLKGEIADKFGSKILNLLLEKEKKILLSEISNHIDKHGSLYLRIDKQSIFSNRLIQSPIDPLRVKMKIRPKLPPQEMIKSFWRLLSIPN
jgi:RNA binding exosome subunit